MEQIEDGQEDHNVLAVPFGEQAEVDHTVQQILSEFVCGLFEHVIGKQSALVGSSGASRPKRTSRHAGIRTTAFDGRIGCTLGATPRKKYSLKGRAPSLFHGLTPAI
jgi:hypothetical protein